jgi:hypothetical protein
MRFLFIVLAAALALAPLSASAAEMKEDTCRSDSSGYCHFEYFPGENSGASYDHDFTIHANGPNPIVAIYIDRKDDSERYDFGQNFLAEPCLPNRPCEVLPVGGDFLIHFGVGTATGTEHFGDCMQYVEVKYGNGQRNYDIMHLDTCKHSFVNMNR